MDSNLSRTKPSPENHAGGHLWISNRIRFIMLFYLLLCLTSVWSNILSFNIAVLCMHPHRTQNTSVSSEVINIAKENRTEAASNESVELTVEIEQSNDPAVTGIFIKEVIWYTPHDKSILISAVAVGALIAHFPIIWLIGHYGIRMVFGVLGLLSAFATLLIPLAARIDLYCFVAVRILQGFAYAANFSVIGSFLNKWSCVKQNGLFISVLVVFFQLSPTITMPAGGYICANFEWPYIYYAHGIASLLLFIVFIAAYRNSPNKHPFVSDIELNKISVGKGDISKAVMRAVPYLPIMSTMAVWAVWICAIANFYFENLVFFFAPTYLHAVLGFQVHDTGLTAALPPLLHFVIKISCGIASDKIRSIGDTAKVKVFNSLAFFGCGICLIALAFMGDSQKFLCLVSLSISTGFLGLTSGGFYKSASLIARHYAAFVTGNVSLTMTVTMLVVPFAASTIAPDNSIFQWQILFLSTAALLISAGVVFLAFGSARPATWTQTPQCQIHGQPVTAGSKNILVLNNEGNANRPN